MADGKRHAHFAPYRLGDPEAPLDDATLATSSWNWPRPLGTVKAAGLLDALWRLDERPVRDRTARIACRVESGAGHCSIFRKDGFMIGIDNDIARGPGHAEMERSGRGARHDGLGARGATGSCWPVRCSPRMWWRWWAPRPMKRVRPSHCASCASTVLRAHPARECGPQRSDGPCRVPQPGVARSIDHAFVMVPGAQVIDALEQSAGARRARGDGVFRWLCGTWEAGMAAQQALAARARALGVRLLGPNSIGVVDVHSGAILVGQRRVCWRWTRSIAVRSA
jgi:hypothetical protein